MRRTPDATQLLASANPVIVDRMSDSPSSAAAQALLEDILTMDQPQAPTRLPRRRTTPVLVAAMLVLTATAAWAMNQDGELPDPAFHGETWNLRVGESRNGAGSDTFKVCHAFERRAGANMGNGFGVAGCETLPSDKIRPVIIDVIPAVHEGQVIALFVNLTTVPVAKVSVTPDRGPTVEVRPYVLPQTRKQFAVAEVPDDVRTAKVLLFDFDGKVIERRTVNDLTMTPSAGS